MHDTKVNLGRWARAGLIAGALAGCGGSGGEPAAPDSTPAAGQPSGDKHQCKAGHGCSGDMDMKGEGAAGAAPHVPE